MESDQLRIKIEQITNEAIKEILGRSKAKEFTRKEVETMIKKSISLFRTKLAHYLKEQALIDEAEKK